MSVFVDFTDDDFCHFNYYRGPEAHCLSTSFHSVVLKRFTQSQGEFGRGDGHSGNGSLQIGTARSILSPPCVFWGNLAGLLAFMLKKAARWLQKEIALASSVEARAIFFYLWPVDGQFFAKNSLTARSTRVDWL